MKRIFLLVGITSIVMSSHSKTILISPCKKSARNEQKMHGDIQKLLACDDHHTILTEVQTVEQALEILPYFCTLKQRNKTIICKAPENIAELLAWSPFIDQAITSDSPAPYTVKIPHNEIVSSVSPSYEKPLLIIDDTAAAMWQDTVASDPHFKIGIYCQSLNSDLPTTQTITAKTFFPLGLLQNVSIYSFDIIQDALPEQIVWHYFDHQTKKSFTSIATLIDHLDIIITTQPTIAMLAQALHKTVWLITPLDIDLQQFKKKYPRIDLLTESTEERVLCSVLRKLSLTPLQPSCDLISAEIALGELIDKITILQIKTEQISDPTKLENIYRELESLQRTCNASITPNQQLEQLTAQLKHANYALWITEDLIRDKERSKCFDDEFIALARAVYMQNDERCRVKRCINELLGSRLIEEKSYKPY